MSDEGRARICVPVCARRADELRPSVARAAEVADIVELRLDCLDEDQLDSSRPRLAELVFVETVEAQFYYVCDLSRARDRTSQFVRAARADGDADACSSLVAHLENTRRTTIAFYNRG